MSGEAFALGDNPLKILTVAGPLFASSLAITYDVGFFAGIGIGFFSFFSLSEHLVFALQSLPFAILPVLILLFWFTTGWYSYRLGYQDATASDDETKLAKSKPNSMIRWLANYVRLRPWLQRLYVAFTFLFILFGISTGVYAGAFLLVGSLIYAINAPVIHEGWKSRSPFLITACVVATLMFSFLIGAQRAHAIVNSQNASETIGVEDKSIPARLIRGGDRGVLFFSIDAKKVRFLRWDAIKQIETL